MKKLDTVIINSNYKNKLFAGKIGFIIEVRNDNEENEKRYDVQFPFDYTVTNTGHKNNQVFQQAQVSEDEITLLQSHSI